MNEGSSRRSPHSWTTTELILTSDERRACQPGRRGRVTHPVCVAKRKVGQPFVRASAWARTRLSRLTLYWRSEHFQYRVVCGQQQPDRTRVMRRKSPPPCTANGRLLSIYKPQTHTFFVQQGEEEEAETGTMRERAIKDGCRREDICV